MNESRAFLQQLFGDKPADQYIHLWTLKKNRSGVELKRSAFFLTIDEAVAFVEANQDRNIWAGCGTRRRAFPSPERGKAKDVTGIPGLWLDIDIANEAHKSDKLPSDEAAAAQVIADLGIEPTFIVHSGHGLQPWWIFEEFWAFDSDEEHDQAALLAKSLTDRLKAVAKPHGYKVDSVHDLARIMRVPGSRNFKTANPVPARIWRNNGPTWTVEALQAQIEANDTPEPEPAQESKPVQTVVSTDFSDPYYWLARYVSLGNQDNTRHDHGVTLACELRDNCKEHGLTKLQEVIDAYRVAMDDPNDPYPDSEIKSLYDILSEPPREPAGGPKGVIVRKSHEPKPKPKELNKELAYYPQTDLGNAERFLARHGDHVRYCHLWGKWFIWDGTRWKEDSTEHIIRLGAEVARAMIEEAKTLSDESHQTALKKHARRSESDAKVRAMTNLARAWVAVAPDELDTDPWLLNCKNGTIDLRTGELLSHRQDNLLTKLAPVEYDPKAECSVWLGFLHNIFEGNHELISYIQRAAGYALTGVIREQVLFFLHGVGSNGKSTFLTVIQDVLGDYACDTPTETLMIKQSEGISNDVARLKGARFVTAVEAEADKRMAESLVKRITGGDTITARFMRQEFFQFRGTFKIFLAANHRPTVRGTDDGIWRRIKMIPFLVRIPDDQQDAELPDKLRAEASGILTWMVQGCRDWQQNKLGEPQEVIAATAAYRDEQDWLGAFISDRCEIKPNATVEASRLYKDYLDWCETTKDKPVSQHRFGRLMSDRPGIVKIRNTSERGYRGICLMTDMTDPEPENHAQNDAMTLYDASTYITRVAKDALQPIGLKASQSVISVIKPEPPDIDPETEEYLED